LSLPVCWVKMLHLLSSPVGCSSPVCQILLAHCQKHRLLFPYLRPNVLLHPEQNCWQRQKTTPSLPGKQFGGGALSFSLASLPKKKSPGYPKYHSRITQIAALKFFGCPIQSGTPGMEVWRYPGMRICKPWVLFPFLIGCWTLIS